MNIFKRFLWWCFSDEINSVLLGELNNPKNTGALNESDVEFFKSAFSVGASDRDLLQIVLMRAFEIMNRYPKVDIERWCMWMQAYCKCKGHSNFCLGIERQKQVCQRY